MKLYSDEELAQHLSNINLPSGQNAFRLIGQVAEQLGVDAYVVGGYVRDIFLERPSKDIDVVVVSPDGKLKNPGIALAEALTKNLRAERLKAHLSVFRNFGTAQVKIQHDNRKATDQDHLEKAIDQDQLEKADHQETELEFVGARRESYSRDSRKPIVEDGTLDDDLDRRDLTINALAICLNTSRFGELIDRFDGLYDMEDRIIRTPLDPDITFSDDPLRMLRAIRFATQLGFQIDDETFEALERNKERIRIISQERIIDELNKIMLSPHPSIGWVELNRCGLLSIIFPELAALEGVETVNGRAHKDNFYHTLEVLENVVATTESEASLWLRWAALLHDIGKPRSKRWEPGIGWTFHNHNYLGEKMIPGIFRRMKLPMDERMKFVQKLVSLHMRPIVIADEEVTDSAVRRLLFEAGEDIDLLMTLCEADITSKNNEKKRRFLQNFQLVREKLKDLQERDNYRTWVNPITGEEIMETFNLKPCREVGLLKQAIKDAIWASEIENTHEAAFALLLEKAGEMGLNHD